MFAKAEESGAVTSQQLFMHKRLNAAAPMCWDVGLQGSVESDEQ